MTLGVNTARDASGISYLASDGLGSVTEALSPSGSATGAVLYSPYGGVRYTSGTMPTSKGFTGQYSDAASSGLDYYGARYYDPSLGQLTSADTANDGLNRYGYVKGNPETFTDPTGHRIDCDTGDCGGRPGSTPPPPERAASGHGECDNEPAICGQIMRTFHNRLTYETLLFIAETGSSIGMKILTWILNIGKTLGDSFISWDGQTHGGAGYTDSGGFIHLQDLGNIGSNAGALIHEGVEAYYAIQHGVRSQASQQMDYLAERYTGMFKSQSGRYAPDNGCEDDDSNCQFYGSYGLSFQQWRATKGGHDYASQPLIQAEVQFGIPVAPGHVLYRTGSFGLFPVAQAVNGGSIAELDAAYSELYNPNISSPLPGGTV